MMKHVLALMPCCLKSDLAAYKRRLHLTAVRLPKQLVADVVGKIKGNIEAIYQDKGGRTKLD